MHDSLDVTWCYNIIIIIYLQESPMIEGMDEYVNE